MTFYRRVFFSVATLGGILAFTIVFFVYLQLKHFSISLNEPICGAPFGDGVLVFGDSWVSSPSFQNQLALTTDYKRNIEFIAYPGHTTKALLTKLMSIKDMSEILKSKGIGEVIIISGVNDVAGGFGADFYTHHIIQMSHFFRSFCAEPKILELPEFGRHALKRDALGLIKFNIFQLLNEPYVSDIISHYRKYLRDFLSSSTVKLQIIPFSSVAKDYDSSLELYRNPSHLSERGDKRLAQVIASAID